MEKAEKPHVLGYGQLALVLGLLLILTGLTVAVSYVHLGFWNVPVALSIASLKAASNFTPNSGFDHGCPT